MSHSLDKIQQWLQTVITHPDGVKSGVVSSDATRLIDVSPSDVECVILPSRQMSSLDRLQIYGRAYYGRLIECLRSQFPAVRHAVGDEAFDGFAFGYLIQHPSSTYTLGALGSAFDAYLTATRPPRIEPHDSTPHDFADFLIELAQLERTYNEVFDGPGPESSRSIHPSDFNGLTPKAFASCRLILHPCVRLLRFHFPVHQYASAIRQGTQPQPPEARPICLAVTRRDYVVRRFEVSEQQFDLLATIEQKTTIGEALQKLCEKSDIDIAMLATELRKWFEDWTMAPLFASLSIECDR